jgi:hypothetical protein
VPGNHVVHEHRGMGVPLLPRQLFHQCIYILKDWENGSWRVWNMEALNGSPDLGAFWGEHLSPGLYTANTSQLERPTLLMVMLEHLDICTYSSNAIYMCATPSDYKYTNKMCLHKDCTAHLHDDCGGGLAQRDKPCLIDDPRPQKEAYWSSQARPIA